MFLRLAKAFGLALLMAPLATSAHPNLRALAEVRLYLSTPLSSLCACCASLNLQMTRSAPCVPC